MANWNALLRKSNGRFVQFVHHDESPESLMFYEFAKSLQSITPNPVPFLRFAPEEKGFGTLQVVFIKVKSEVCSRILPPS